MTGSVQSSEDKFSRYDVANVGTSHDTQVKELTQDSTSAQEVPQGPEVTPRSTQAYLNQGFDGDMSFDKRSESYSMAPKDKEPGHCELFGLPLPCLNRFLTAKWLLACLCCSAVVQGMIFTNVVISSIERRFGLQSTQSGIIAGSYDFGSLLAVIPVTYFGGRPGASKPHYIACGMVIMGTGSLLFASPHFVTGRYLNIVDNMVGIEITNMTRKENPMGLCVPGPKNQTCTPDEMRSAQDLSDYQYVFIWAQILHGVGAAALVTLGTTLLDESVTKKSAPMYIGIFEASFVLGPALGYVVGGRLLNIFTEFYLLQDYLEPGEKPADYLSLDSPKWIGAWWLGFLIILVLSYACALLLFLFPAVIPQPKEENENEKSKGHVIKNDDYYALLKDLPHALYKLVSNPTYMCISLGAVMDGFLLTALAAFLPKYFESQFHLSPGYAAMLVGVIVVPAGAGGTIMGGYLGKHFHLTRSGSIKMYIICQALVIPLYLGFLLYCPNGDFAGVTTDKVGNFTYPDVSFRSECNLECENCDISNFDPVCSLGDDVTFYNPCFAGCSSAFNGSVFMECSCVSPLSELRVATRGQCESGKCSYIYFSLFLFLQLLFTFAATMPGLVASLRSVEMAERSLSLGLQTIMIRGLGTVPGPIIFGYIMDSTCILWHHNDCNGDKGFCIVYDNFSMSLYVMVIVITWRLIGALFFGGALYHSRHSHVKEEEDEDGL